MWLENVHRDSVGNMQSLLDQRVLTSVLTSKVISACQFCLENTFGSRLSM